MFPKSAGATWGGRSFQVSLWSVAAGPCCIPALGFHQHLLASALGPLPRVHSPLFSSWKSPIYPLRPSSNASSKKPVLILPMSLLSCPFDPSYISALAQTPRRCPHLSPPGCEPLAAETTSSLPCSQSIWPKVVLWEYISHELFMMWLISVMGPTYYAHESYQVLAMIFMINIVE